MTLIPILIAGGNSIWRRGLRDLMSNSDEVRLVEEVDSLPELFAQPHRLKFDVVILDAELLPSGGNHAIQELKRRIFPPPGAIILSDCSGDPRTEALLLGADACLPRDTPYTELVEAIKRVHEGETLASSRQIADLVRRSRAMAYENVLLQTDLSDTELRILERLACGDTYEQIGSRLFLSKRTVIRKVQSAVTKMDANNRTHAVAKAIRRGLI